jgi:hypothetical protein
VGNRVGLDVLEKIKTTFSQPGFEIRIIQPVAQFLKFQKRNRIREKCVQDKKKHLSAKVSNVFKQYVPQMINMK